MSFTVDFKGMNDALSTLLDIVVPWRRENAKLVAKLLNAQRQSDIHRANSEILVIEAKAKRELAIIETDQAQSALLLAQAKKTEAEAEHILAEAEKARAEAAKMHADVRQKLIELALRIVDRYAIELNEFERMNNMIALLPILDKLVFSELEPKLPNPDN